MYPDSGGGSFHIVNELAILSFFRFGFLIRSVRVISRIPSKLLTRHLSTGIRTGHPSLAKLLRLQARSGIPSVESKSPSIQHPITANDSQASSKHVSQR